MPHVLLYAVIHCDFTCFGKHPITYLLANLETETDRDRDRNRETDRQTETERLRERQTHRDRQTDRQAVREKQRETETDRHGETHADTDRDSGSVSQNASGDACREIKCPRTHTRFPTFTCVNVCGWSPCSCGSCSLYCRRVALLVL